MAHYALLKGFTVSQVITGRDENDLVDGIESWEDYYGDLHRVVCKRTSYNTFGGVHYDPETREPSADQSKAFRYNYAGIGYTFDETKGTDGAFIPPKPYESWVLDEATCLWQAPIPYPEDGAIYTWDEDGGDWVEVVNEAT